MITVSRSNTSRHWIRAVFTGSDSDEMGPMRLAARRDMTRPVFFTRSFLRGDACHVWMSQTALETDCHFGAFCSS
uniref:Uncharacterized protein n=1 Tax=Arundo donax TaxID=35708 RepID=A0A0A9PXR4_ARUDO